MTKLSIVKLEMMKKIVFQRHVSTGGRLGTVIKEKKVNI